MALDQTQKIRANYFFKRFRPNILSKYFVRYFVSDRYRSGSVYDGREKTFYGLPYPLPYTSRWEPKNTVGDEKFNRTQKYESELFIFE